MDEKNGRTDGRTDDGTDGRTYGRIYGRTDGRTVRWTDERPGGSNVQSVYFIQSLPPCLNVAKTRSFIHSFLRRKRHRRDFANRLFEVWKLIYSASDLHIFFGSNAPSGLYETSTSRYFVETDSEDVDTHTDTDSEDVDTHTDTDTEDVDTHTDTDSDADIEMPTMTMNNNTYTDKCRKTQQTSTAYSTPTPSRRSSPRN